MSSPLLCCDEQKKPTNSKTRYIVMLRHSKNINSEIWHKNRDGKNRPYVIPEIDYLTEEGRRIAEYTGIRLDDLLQRRPHQYLKHEKWNMYCSPALRAQETAHIILSSTGRDKNTDIKIDNDLAEVTDAYTQTQNTAVRVRRLIHSMLSKTQNHATITVYVTHAMLIRMVLREVLKLPDNVMTASSLAGITILETDGDNIAIHTMNDSHADVSTWNFGDLIHKIPKLADSTVWHDSNNPPTPLE